MKVTFSLFILLFAFSAPINGQETGAFIDERDGFSYKWVKIGDQVWMAENLSFNAGIPSSKNRIQNVTNHGKQYNWETSIKACPKGWYLPSAEEWDHLANYISDRHSECKDSANTWFNVGKYLKSTDGWLFSDYGQNGNDLYGFSAKSGDINYNYGSFVSASWWTSDKSSDNTSWLFELNAKNQDLIKVTHWYKSVAYIRCVKGSNNIIYKPIIITLEPSEIKNNKAVLKGKVKSCGAAEITGYGFEWKLYGEDSIRILSKSSSLPNSDSTFYLKLPDLKSDRIYKYRAFAVNAHGKSFGNERTFGNFHEAFLHSFGKQNPCIVYLTGSERTTIRITSISLGEDFTWLNHSTIINSQTIINQGRNERGQIYVDLEMKINIPDSLHIDSKYPVEEKLLSDSVKRYLNIESVTMGYEEVFKNLVDSLTKNANYVYLTDIVSDFISWIHNFIHYDYKFSRDQDAITVLDRKTGTCEGFANITLALLRTAGIPCRKIGCIVPPGCGWGFSESGGLHAFIEVFYPGYGWMPCDPQNSIHLTDPFHIVTSLEGKGNFFKLNNFHFRFIESENWLRQSSPIKVGCHDEMYGLHFSHQKIETMESRTFAFEKKIERLDGTIEEITANPTRITHFADSITITEYPDGKIKKEKINADGSTSIFHQDGSKETRYPDGMLVTEYSDGRTVTLNKYGSKITEFSDTRKEILNTDKSILTINPNGDSLYVYPCLFLRKKRVGSDTQIKFPFGYSKFTYKNGDIKMVCPNGKEVYYYKNGQKIISYPNGKIKLKDRILKFIKSIKIVDDVPQPPSRRIGYY